MIVRLIGRLTLSANQQGSPSNGNFVGVSVSNAVVQSTGSGSVSVRGKGGTTSLFQFGVWVQNGGRISGGTTGNVNVTGFGGNTTTGDVNFGVYVIDTNSTITSVGGNVSDLLGRQ